MRRMHAAAIPLTVLVPLFAGCSSDDPSDPDSSAADAAVAHSQCMRDHGVDWPDPEYVDGEWRVDPGDDIDLESPAYKQAEAECAQVLDRAGPDDDAVDDPADRAQIEKDMERMLEFAECMRGEGIDFPDPQIDESGNIAGPAGPLDGDWEAFDAAREICEDETGQSMP